MFHETKFKNGFSVITGQTTLTACISTHKGKQISIVVNVDKKIIVN